MQPETVTVKTLAQSKNEMSLSDALACAQVGDKRGFEKLYLHYKAEYKKLLYRLVEDLNVAEDLYQETFIRVWKELQAKKSLGNFEGWLRRVAVNLAIDYLRHKQCLVMRPLPELETDDPKEYALAAKLTSPGHETGVVERDLLLEVLTTLSPQYKICIVLQVIWGYSQREIAQMLSIEERTVSANVSRGMKKMREKYLQAMQENPTLEKGGKAHE